MHVHEIVFLTKEIWMKDFIKKHAWLYNIAFMVIVFGKRQISFWLKYLFRLAKIKGKYDYDKLKSYKDIHKGERCFVVGTGPSLLLSDLEKLDNEYTFSVNSIVLSFDDTDWRPTYYAIQDKFGYEKLRKEIESSDLPVIFNGISDQTMTPQIKRDFVPFPLNLLDHGKQIPNHMDRFSGNAFKAVYAGHSITYSVLELAVYMGFSEIVLIGVDCDYSKKVNHVKAYSKQDDPNAAYLMRESFIVAKKYADEHGIEIVNATRKAHLDVFPRVDIETYFK